MNQSIKAALLSALVFPGLGQITIGYKRRGWIIIALNGLLLIMIIRQIMQKAYAIIAEIQKNGASIDIESITNITTKLTGFSENIFLNTLLTLLIISWVYAIYDAYRLGKAM